MHKEIKLVVKAAQQRGWKLITGLGGHHMLRHPSGRKLTVSVSPSDRNAYKVLERAIKRVEKEHA